MDKSNDSIYEKSLKRQEDSPDVVHLTHLTTPESIYHLRIGFSSLASMPENHKWYIWFMWPLTLWTTVTNCIYGRTFILERNSFEKFNFQSWAIPRYNLQVLRFPTSDSSILKKKKNSADLFYCAVLVEMAITSY